MNFKNKYLVITLRSLLGLMFLFSGVTGFMAAFSGWQGVPEPMVASTQVLWDTGIFQLIKVTEIVTGLMLITAFLPWLALLALAPLCVGIIVVNARISPAYLPMGIIVTLVTIYLAYVYWDKYKQLFERK